MSTDHIISHTAAVVLMSSKVTLSCSSAPLYVEWDLHFWIINSIISLSYLI